MNRENLFALLQITDSAFPIGGFSHSLGLEAYIQHYEGTAKKHIEHDVMLHALICIIENSGSMSVPFVREAYHLVNEDKITECDQPQDKSFVFKTKTNCERNGHSRDELKSEHEAEKSEEEQAVMFESLVRLDQLYEACTANHIANRASTQQGRSLLEASLYTFPHLEGQGIASLCTQLPHCHHAVLYGAIMGCLGLALEDVVSSFMFGVVRTLVGTAVRLDAIGTMEGQKLQWKLQEICSDVIARNQTRLVDQASIKYPVLDILQNTQDTLFAKLFYS